MSELVTLTIEKLVHGGQGLAVLPDGKKVFVWNALPDEIVEARIIKNKRTYSEAIAENINQASPERIEAQETNYLATSPWQIMHYDFENISKRQIVLDVMAQEGVIIPEVPLTRFPIDPWQYRNKMEYSFWGDDDGLHLALHQRGSHGKQIVKGSKLALPAIDNAANQICAQLQSLDVRAGDLKTIIVRCNQAGQSVVALFVKPSSFPPLELPDSIQGLRVYHSNPKSPASVATELIQELGDPSLYDELLGNSFSYDVDSFFQVNIPIFESALERIRELSDVPALIDMYAGVGSIGLSVAKKSVTLVELDLATATMAAVNAEASQLNTEVIETSAEKSLDYIISDTPVIVDPPRAGLHPKVTQQLLAAAPPFITYLSCNPITQARDLAVLADKYDITVLEVFNFFPRTPHIESLVHLKRRD